MDKFFAYLDPKSPLPLPERQARLLAAILCIFYTLAAVYLFVYGATLLLQWIGGRGVDRLSWRLGIVALSILLAAVTLGLWRMQRLAIVFSALILIAALVYSLIGDIELGSWALAILKGIIIGPAIATGHMRLWKENQRIQQASR